MRNYQIMLLITIMVLTLAVNLLVISPLQNQAIEKSVVKVEIKNEKFTNESIQIYYTDILVIDNRVDHENTIIINDDRMNQLNIKPHSEHPVIFNRPGKYDLKLLSNNSTLQVKVKKNIVKDIINLFS